ncbi:MAG: TIGR02147 family protein [Bdellovibrionia bacterium]
MNSTQGPHSSGLESRDFRRYLQQELIRRCEKNPGYSLRSFARSLGIHHTTLSRLIAGKRGLNSKSIQRLCGALKLSQAEASLYLDGKATEAPPLDSAHYQNLALDTFISISEWYHDAILELTHIQGFKGDPKWIATKLGIKASQVKTAVERLQRLELLSITPRNQWIDLSRDNTTNVSNDITSAALRKLQKQILELSMEALEEIPRAHRDHSSTTLAIEAADLPEIKERIKKFRFELTSFVQRKSVKANSVYQLAVSFFPLTPIEIPKGDL